MDVGINDWITVLLLLIVCIPVKCACTRPKKWVLPLFHACCECTLLIHLYRPPEFFSGSAPAGVYIKINDNVATTHVVFLDFNAVLDSSKFSLVQNFAKLPPRPSEKFFSWLQFLNFFLFFKFSKFCASAPAIPHPQLAN